MHVGIIVYSQTGNTLQVAEQMKKSFLDRGCKVDIERVEIVETKEENPKNPTLKYAPDPTKYEGLVFGSPIHAFSVAPPMKAYLKQMPSIKGKDVACYVTKSLIFTWTGGTGSVKKMKRLTTEKGGKVVDTGIIVWRDKTKEPQTKNVVESFVKKF